jgi:hypothetical protein
VSTLDGDRNIPLSAHVQNARFVNNNVLMICNLYDKKSDIEKMSNVQYQEKIALNRHLNV